MSYLRDPAAIYDESFAIIRRDADLARFPQGLRDVAIRMIHACGMPDLAEDILWGGDPHGAAGEALSGGAAILCDCEMVRAGIAFPHLRQRALVTLNDPAVAGIAQKAQTTRSAAAVDLWRDRLGGAVVIIGNAPTALFRLLELLVEPATPQPAAIIAAPVGFVGAAESKALLAQGKHGVPFLTVRGRRGGSAIAAAAFNSIAAGVSG